MSHYEDWFSAAVLLAAAWSLAGARRDLEQSDSAVVGTVRARAPIPWAIDSIHPMLTRIMFVLLTFYGGLCLFVGFRELFTAGKFMMLSLAALPLVFAFQYCKRPFSLTVGALGFSWHGQSYGWHEVAAHIDHDRKLLHFRILPNGTTRRYGAFRYIHLSTASAESMELLDAAFRSKGHLPWQDSTSRTS